MSKKNRNSMYVEAPDGADPAAQAAVASGPSVRWEYTTLRKESQALEPFLNELGQLGWELVSVTNLPSTMLCVLKRPIAVVFTVGVTSGSSEPKTMTASTAPNTRDV